MAQTRGASKQARKASPGFSKEERAATKERARELKSRSRAGKADGGAEVLAKIAAMHGSDRVMATRLHALIRATAPSLTPRTWYGMPAYANPAGQVVCFFRDAAKFQTRYAMLGFSDEAKLDDGRMWPTDVALTELTPAEERGWPSS